MIYVFTNTLYSLLYANLYLVIICMNESYASYSEMAVVQLSKVPAKGK